MKIKQLFHYISYLQYPLMLVGMYFSLQPYIQLFVKNGDFFENFYTSINSMLIFMGLGISFSTLQDTTKTQNNFSKKIWENPKKGKFFIVFMTFFTLILIILGLIGFFSLEESNLKELSFGILVLGVGLIGMIKSAIEMFENHRLDKTEH